MPETNSISPEARSSHLLLSDDALFSSVNRSLPFAYLSPPLMNSPTLRSCNLLGRSSRSKCSMRSGSSWPRFPTEPLNCFVRRFEMLVKLEEGGRHAEPVEMCWTSYRWISARFCRGALFMSSKQTEWIDVSPWSIDWEGKGENLVVILPATKRRTHRHHSSHSCWHPLINEETNESIFPARKTDRSSDMKRLDLISLSAMDVVPSDHDDDHTVRTSILGLINRCVFTFGQRTMFERISRCQRMLFQSTSSSFFTLLASLSLCMRFQLNKSARNLSKWNKPLVGRLHRLWMAFGVTRKHFAFPFSRSQGCFLLRFIFFFERCSVKPPRSDRDSSSSA